MSSNPDDTTNGTTAEPINKPAANSEPTAELSTEELDRVVGAAVRMDPPSRKNIEIE